MRACQASLLTRARAGRAWRACGASLIGCEAVSRPSRSCGALTLAVCGVVWRAVQRGVPARVLHTDTAPRPAAGRVPRVRARDWHRASSLLRVGGHLSLQLVPCRVCVYRRRLRVDRSVTRRILAAALSAHFAPHRAPEPVCDAQCHCGCTWSTTSSSACRSSGRSRSTSPAIYCCFWPS